jgi:hypothetical protein
MNVILTSKTNQLFKSPLGLALSILSLPCVFTDVKNLLKKLSVHQILQK